MKAGLRRHADTHDPDKGSDPIRITAIRFDVDNEGGWLYVQPNDCFDLDLLPDPLAVGGTWGGVIEDASGCGMLIGSTTVLRLEAGTVAINALVSPLTINVNGKDFQFLDDGTIVLDSGAVIGP